MACDFWPSDVKKLQDIQKNIDVLLKETRTSTETTRGKNAAILRGNIARMAQTFSQLEHCLMQASEMGDLFGVDEGELERRRIVLEKLGEKKEEQIEIFKTLFSYEETKQQKQQSQKIFANDGFLEDFPDNSTNATIDDRLGTEGGSAVYVHSEDVLLQREEEQLSFLEGSITNLKSIGYAIKEEVQIHNRLLDATETEIDKAEAQIKRNKQLIKKLFKRHSTLCLLMIAMALLCLLVFLLVFTA